MKQENNYDNNYPRLLIINYSSIVDANNIGITLRSFLENWPKDNIMELSLEQKKYDGNPESDQIAKSNIISISECVNRRVFDKIYTLIRGIKLFGKTKAIDQNDNVVIRPRTINRLVFLMWQTIMYDFSRIKIDRELLLKVQYFAPDVIYTCGYTLRVLKLSYYFAKSLKINILCHFFDNWLEEDIFKKMYIKKIIKHMPICLTVGEDMANHYSHKYGFQCSYIMNGVAIYEKDNVAERTNTEFIITYVGSLYLHRIDTIIRISECLSYISNKLNIKVLLQIYTNAFDSLISKYMKSLNPTIVKFIKSVPHDQMQNIYMNSDILLHIESFRKADVKFSKYSISTKIPEYMAAGKPIISYAKGGNAVHTIIEKALCGFCVTNDNEFINAFVTLYNDDSLYNRYSVNGMNYVKTYFTKDIMKTKFLNAVRFSANTETYVYDK